MIKERKKSIPKSQCVGQVSIAQFENIKCNWYCILQEDCPAFFAVDTGVVVCFQMIIWIVIVIVIMSNILMNLFYNFAACR